MYVFADCKGLKQGGALYVFADCKGRGIKCCLFAGSKVSIVAVNKIQMCAFATFVSLCGPQE